MNGTAHEDICQKMPRIAVYEKFCSICQKNITVGDLIELQNQKWNHCACIGNSPIKPFRKRLYKIESGSQYEQQNTWVEKIWQLAYKYFNRKN